MLNPKEFYIRSGYWEQLSHNTQIFNLANFKSHIWVAIPHELSIGYEIIEIAHKENSDYVPIDLFQGTERTAQYPWIRFSPDVLDNHIGMHIYRIKMHNTQTDNVVHLFFSYTIQDDDPIKPYYYMEKYRIDEGE